MEMIDQEITRLKNRMTELRTRLIPEFEHKTQVLYALIMTLEKGSSDRDKRETEYAKLSKELSLRSDEVISLDHQVKNLESQKTLRR